MSRTQQQAVALSAARDRVWSDDNARLPVTLTYVAGGSWVLPGRRSQGAFTRGIMGKILSRLSVAMWRLIGLAWAAVRSTGITMMGETCIRPCGCMCRARRVRPADIVTSGGVAAI